MSLEKPLFFNQLSIEAMQSTATLLDLDDKFLFCVSVVLECLEVFYGIEIRS